MMIKIKSVVILAGLFILMPTSAMAEGEQPRLEEVIVTAQKRAQREIDVPIAMTVVDHTFIADQGIADLADLSLYVPNAKINNSAVYPDIRIRGFGTSPINPVFEQSVGLVLDGVPYGNKTFYQGALFDIQHVEVLRGPQGALHGKNTTAGLLNIITHRPSEETEFSLQYQNGDIGTERVEAAVGTGLFNDRLLMRLAFLDEQRDAYFENTTAQTNPTAPKEPGAREREAFRLRAVLPDVFGSEWMLTWEHSDSRINGGTEFRRIPERTRDFVRKYDPNADFEPYNGVGSYDHPDYVEIGVDALVLSGDWTVGEWGMSLIAAYAELEDFLENDSDFSPAPSAFTVSGRTTTQETFEWRASSPVLEGALGLAKLGDWDLGSSEFIGGVLFQQRQIDDLFNTLNINDAILVEFAAVEGGAPTVPIPVPMTGAENEQSTVFYDDEAETLAVFGQWDWHLSDAWTLSTGLRWSEESRTARIRRQYDTENTAVFQGVLGWEEFDRTLDRKEQHVSPKISLNWQPSDEVSVFLSWGNAYKSGGFNAYASGGSDRELTFDAEVVEQWAIDVKLRLLERHRLNISLFYMNLEDFQVLTANPSDLKITIENAAEAVSQGLELDWTWMAHEYLDVRASFGFNDTEFIEFPIATCPQDRPNSDGDDEERCDVSGESLVRAPKYTGTLTPTLTLPLARLWGERTAPQWISSIGLLASFTAEYQSEQFLNDDLDERKMQESFWRYHGSVGIGDLDRSWSLRVIGRNLSDEQTAVSVGEIPAVAPGHFYQIPEPGRIVSMQLQVAL